MPQSHMCCLERRVPPQTSHKFENVVQNAAQLHICLRTHPLLQNTIGVCVWERHGKCHSLIFHLIKLPNWERLAYVMRTGSSESIGPGVSDGQLETTGKHCGQSRLTGRRAARTLTCPLAWSHNTTVFTFSQCWAQTRLALLSRCSGDGGDDYMEMPVSLQGFIL